MERTFTWDHPFRYCYICGWVGWIPWAGYHIVRWHLNRVGRKMEDQSAPAAARRGFVDWAVDVFSVVLTTACFWAVADSLPRVYVTGLMTFLGLVFGIRLVLERLR